MRCSRVMLVLVVAIVSALAVSAAPIVIVSNLAEAPVGVDGGLNAAAQSFTTGSTAETLQDVQLDLLGGAGGVNVFLFSDSAGLPGSDLLSLGSLTPVGVGFADYTASGTFSLAANTKYWVLVDYLGSPSWGFANVTTFTGNGTLGPYTNSSDGGVTWRGPFTDNQPYLLEVDAKGSTVPEPSGIALAAIGIGTMLLFKRRARRTV